MAEDKITELLTRSVDRIYPSRETLEKVLHSGKKLKLYQGFDPTGDKLHLGHMVGLKKLAAWQALGHHVIFLIGDFTAMVGDPSGKFSTRKILTHQETLANARAYKEQASKILKFDGNNPAEVFFNGDWLGKLTAIEFLKIAGNLTYSQMVARDMFQERMKQNQDIYINEFLYPVMQAYDSVAMDIDLEIGGKDQTFNMLMGRKLMRNMLKKEKFVITTKLLEDSQGVKIGKTEGNAIALDDKPEDLYGKIMAFPDEAIAQCFEFFTTLPMNEIPVGNPLEAKKKLAFEIVKDLNDEEKAKKARSFWENTFQKRETPEDIMEVSLEEGMTLMDILVLHEIVSSKSDFRRLIKEGAITDLNTDETVRDLQIVPEPGTKFRIGKHRFVRVS